MVAWGFESMLVIKILSLSSKLSLLYSALWCSEWDSKMALLLCHGWFCKKGALPGRLAITVGIILPTVSYPSSGGWFQFFSLTLSAQGSEFSLHRLPVQASRFYNSILFHLFPQPQEWWFLPVSTIPSISASPFTSPVLQYPMLGSLCYNDWSGFCSPFWIPTDIVLTALYKPACLLCATSEPVLT